MANQGFSKTVRKLQSDLEARSKKENKRMDMDMLFRATQFIKGWDSKTTQASISKGRDLFKLCNVLPEEVLGGRLYTVCAHNTSPLRRYAVRPTLHRDLFSCLDSPPIIFFEGRALTSFCSVSVSQGPGFMQYNAVLRHFPQWVLETTKGNKYVTTIHCINSYLLKVSRVSPVFPSAVYRGSARMQLPHQFAAKDCRGGRGDVEMGFISATSNKNIALNYAASGDEMPMLMKLERGVVGSGAPLAPISFYIDEDEICFPCLCSLEVYIDVLFYRLALRKRHRGWVLSTSACRDPTNNALIVFLTCASLLTAGGGYSGAAFHQAWRRPASVNADHGKPACRHS